MLHLQINASDLGFWALFAAWLQTGDYHIVIVIAAATIIKWALSEAATKKGVVFSAVSGGIFGFYGPAFMISQLSFLVEGSHLILAFLLALLGDTLVRTLLMFTPDFLFSLAERFLPKGGK